MASRTARQRTGQRAVTTDIAPVVPGRRGEMRTSTLRAAAREALGKQAFILLLFYIALFVAFAVVSPEFMSTSNLVNVASTSGILMMVTAGQALTIIAGGFDLSVGGVVPLGAVVFALLSNMLPLVPLIIVVLLIGVAIGLVNAGLVSVVGVNPLIATLGMLSVTGGVALTLANGLTIAVPSGIGVLGSSGPGGVPYFMYVVIVIIAAVACALRWTGIGRRIYVVGGNPEAARLAGIRVGAVTAVAYASSALLAAFAGILYASQLLEATGTVGSNSTLISVAAAVLGGVALTGGEGGIGGVVLGVLVLGTVQDGLSVLRVPGFYETIVTGVILLVAMSFGRLRRMGRLRSTATSST